MDQLQNMWQIPYICQFVKLFRGSLNMDVVIPEELEQALSAPDSSPLCAELFTKLLLKKGASRRDLPPGEGFPLEKWHALLAKQLTVWQSIYERYEKSGKLEKFSAAQRIVINMFEEMNGNPFIAVPNQVEETKAEEVPTVANEGVRETRSKTNSLPRSRKLIYTEDYDQSDDMDDEENIRFLHEIKESHRVIVLYYLCTYKMETDDELVHELNYVPLEQQRVQSVGKDLEGAVYYYFNNYDCRIYKEIGGVFTLITRTLEQVKELIIKLERTGSFELARALNGMWADFQSNEQERGKRSMANIRKVQVAQSRRKPELDNDDSDFSPVDDDFNMERRGPGRPRKFQIPERKPKVMPETNGDALVFNGILKKVMCPNETVHSIEGEWQAPGDRTGKFKYAKSMSQDATGTYTGSMDYLDKVIEETWDLVISDKEVHGYGENMFGAFKIDGSRVYEHVQPQIGEVVMGRLMLNRTYLKLEVNDESSCSEADAEDYDDIKPLYKLEFEEKVHLEHMKMPLKSIKDLKKSLKAQEKRELRRVPFYRSEFLGL